jgi:hypothetical protein
MLKVTGVMLLDFSHVADIATASQCPQGIGSYDYGANWRRFKLV